MSFKIVSTRRKGRSELCTVPSLWENKGKLRWPRYNADLLSKDSTVQPRADWLSMSCSLKRNNFQTYEEAEEELTNMLNKTDTDSDQQNSYIQQNLFHRSEPNSTTAGPNYNSMAQDLIDPMANIVAPNQTAISVITDAENVMYEVVSEGTSRQFENVAAQQSLGTDGNQLTLEGINNIYALQQHIMENQDKIMKKLAEISVQVEELRNDRQPTTVTLLGEAKGMEVESFILRPINDIKHLEKLDQDLSNKETFEKLKKQYSIVCSELLGNGVNCAYRLLDILFTKDFLCLCSWTGGSRNAVDVKIGLKAFKNVINFFFTMVNFWDSTYTMEHNENFFKTVLRNALKRKNMKNIRCSAKKRRVNHTINNNKEENNGTGQENSAALQNLNENTHQKDDNQIEEENEEESLC